VRKDRVGMSQGAPGRKESIKEMDEEQDFCRIEEYGSSRTQLRSKDQKKKVEITSGEKSMMSKSFKGGIAAKKLMESSNTKAFVKSVIVPIGAKFSGTNVVNEVNKRMG